MPRSKAARDRFAEWLTSFGEAKFNFGRELADLTSRSRSGIPNEVPPPDLWPNILPALRVAEAFREEFGPTTILSGYRSPAYNRAVDGSAKESRHMRFDALDLRAARGTPREWIAFLRKLRADGMFRGGLGLYNTFVHVDTRGTNADW